MRVWAQAPCLVEFLEEAARPSAEVGPVRPQLRFWGSGFSESCICFPALSVKEGVRGFQKIWGKLLIVGEKIFLEKL
jgi:hypothetical protein